MEDDRMNVKIDVQALMEDDTTRAQIMDEVGKAVVENYFEAIESHIDRELGKIITEAREAAIKKKIGTTVELIIEQAIDEEYDPVGQWGERDKPTTIRAQIKKHVEDALEGRGWNGKSRIKETIDKLVNDELRQVEKTVRSDLSAAVTEDALAVAVKALQKKLGI
jgi:paraquat-inducible protein B